MPLLSILRSVHNTVRSSSDENTILAIWYSSKNWGDALNPVLFQKISGKTPILMTKYTYNIRNSPVYSAVGSVLQIPNVYNCGHGNLVVWGTGLISHQSRLKVQPREICAVRGPLTRRLLLEQGYECPEIYGDPALLCSKFYKSDSQERYKLGIIPHYVDKNHPAVSNFQDDPDVLMIDILGGVREVIDQICSCRRIASSSLHGIIAADAYGIPSTWIKFSDNVVGDGFKFFDYFESVDRVDEGPLVIRESSTIDDILGTYYKYRLNIDLRELWDACPFRAN